LNPTRLIGRRGVTLLACAAAVAAISGAALALSGNDTHVIHACASRTTGLLRLVGSARACKKAERLVSWNVVGPQGEAGATGPQGLSGPQGLQGPQGPQGPEGVVSGAFTITGPTVAVPPSTKNPLHVSRGESIATCPSDSILVSGGYIAYAFSGFPELRVEAELPGSESSPNSWTVRAANGNTLYMQSFQAYARCGR
jgi:hypothetical protein